MESNVYDITDWKSPRSKSSAVNDVGAVINSIIADIKHRQPNPAGKPGAVIYIPPGTYSLKTRVVVDISFLTIGGSGHGLTSLSIRSRAATKRTSSARTCSNAREKHTGHSSASETGSVNRHHRHRPHIPQRMTKTLTNFDVCSA